MVVIKRFWRRRDLRPTTVDICKNVCEILNAHVVVLITTLQRTDAVRPVIGIIACKGKGPRGLLLMNHDYNSHLHGCCLLKMNVRLQRAPFAANIQGAVPLSS